uniref:Putative conserved secreted protein n=1 Tax=Phlebotomus kandelakii TaxID=1109342 RepID=A0A6B2E6F5_9DIPT
MGASTKTSRFALAFTALSFLFVLVAFVSPYWLQHDGVNKSPKFLNLGLWEVCFNKFRDINRWYDVYFKGCMWVFEEEYYIIHDFLLPSFFVATQFFFTICFTLLLVSLFLTSLFLVASKDDDRYIMLLLTNGAVQVIGATCGLIAVITFGARGDGRDWMPNWEHNDMGWAFALAVLGVMILFPAGALFLVEARKIKYKRLNEIGTREASSYSMDDRKVRGEGSGHTDI